MRRSMIAALLLAGSTTSALSADPTAGQQVFKAQCGVSYSVPARANGIGPTLFGVVGQSSGSVPGFQFTADHKKLGVIWDATSLDRYLTNPRATAPDTSMIYAGLKDHDQRADLIAYPEALN